MVSKTKRYQGDRPLYERKLKKHMAELGMKPTDWNLQYDPFEGARLDFTYKGVTRRLDRFIDHKTIFYASDCLAQVTLTIEKFLWMKREGIFDLDVAAAGLPQLVAPIPECFRIMKFDRIPTLQELEGRKKELAKEYHPDVSGGNAEKFKQMQIAYEECKYEITGHRS